MSLPPPWMLHVLPLSASVPCGVGLAMSTQFHDVGQPGDELCTTSVTGVLCVADAPVPVTVTVYVPVGVVVAVAIDIVELLPELTGVGLKLAVAPDGRPLALSRTLCDDPLVTAVLIVGDPLAPGATVTVLGLALIEKS